jgi:membrane-bound metal-dependent hydrolase YbcI (DUF457 family)
VEAPAAVRHVLSRGEHRPPCCPSSRRATLVLASVPGSRKSTDGRNTFVWVRNVTHELIGVSVALGAAKAAELGPVETTVAAGAAVIGAWLPDVDQLGSRIHRRSRLERRNLVVGAAGGLLRLPLFPFGALISHRAVTHSVLACVAVAAGAGLLLAPLGLSVAAILAGGLGVGYAGHVFADACTPAGVWLWWPLLRRRVWLLPARHRIATGSVRELLLAACVLALAAVRVVA